MSRIASLRNKTLACIGTMQGTIEPNTRIYNDKSDNAYFGENIAPGNPNRFIYSSWAGRNGAGVEMFWSKNGYLYAKAADDVRYKSSPTNPNWQVVNPREYDSEKANDIDNQSGGGLMSYAIPAAVVIGGGLLIKKLFFSKKKKDK